MLGRSATRRQHHRTASIIAASFAQLNLPWLAPAQLRWTASQAYHNDFAPLQTSRTRKPCAKRLSGLGSTANRRRLATAASDQNQVDHDGQFPYPASMPEDHVPWDVVSARNQAQLRPFGEPLIIGRKRLEPEPLYKMRGGVIGTASDLLQHLRTSLQIGREARAAAIVRRLQDQQPRPLEEIVIAHQIYLEHLYTQLAAHGRGVEAERTLNVMTSWFEMQIRPKEIPISPTVLILMIKGSIRALSGQRRERTIRRYAEMGRAMSAEDYEEVLYSEQYDDNEFTVLGSVMAAEMEDVEEAEEGTLAAQILDASKATELEDVPADTLPQVLSTVARSGRLSGLRKAMSVVRNTPLAPAPCDSDTANQERQRIMEETSVDVAIDHWRKADEELRKIGIRTALNTKTVGAIMWQWYQALLKSLESELTECKKLTEDIKSNKPGNRFRVHYAPFFQLVPLPTIAATTIITLTHIFFRKHHGDSNVEGAPERRLIATVAALADAIEQEAESLTKKLKRERKIAEVQANSELDSESTTIRRFQDHRRDRRVKGRNDLELAWPTQAKIKLGAMLLTKVLETAQMPVTKTDPQTREKVTRMQPAFFHRTRFLRGKKVNMIHVEPSFADKMKSEPIGSLITKHMPMLVAPNPWTAYSEGGYLHHPVSVLRQTAGDTSSRDYIYAAHRNGDMFQVFEGLSALGSVAWKVHPDVLRVQLDAWNSGEEIANIAPLHLGAEAPQQPEGSSDVKSRWEFIQELQKHNNKRASNHSQRCFQNFQLEIARTFRNETFYFPHSMDFRGRAYPITPYLNHMGADNVRGLLVFAKGKELGETGLRWLKIHVATVAGHDKANMDDRVKFTMDHLDDIYDSVRNPLQGRRWWLEADDSWQTLAACFELVGALESPDPKKFVSHLPIQQDGTCNGLQHYAALGGDLVGAAQVNLVPGERPADIYTAVAESVKLEVAKDAAAGHPIAQKLHGRITRKCVKQPVMTNVYGVTWYGAKEQVLKQLEDIFKAVPKEELGDVSLAQMSSFVAEKIFMSLGQMFTGAQAIQNWLGQCASRITSSLTPEQIADFEQRNTTRPRRQITHRKGRQVKMSDEEQKSEKASTSVKTVQQVSSAANIFAPHFKSAVVWTTPLRMPVAQPYRVPPRKMITTSLQDIGIQEPQAWHPVHRRKQLQGFPPNFIHSLDASHMMLSALKCKANGITFASIHDSFWCHASDVNEMSTHLREAFIAMHKEDIVGRLREEMETRYKGHMCLTPIFQSSKAGEAIKRWRASRGAVRDIVDNNSGLDELLLESERQRLLASEGAEQRAKGEAMVTPASIFDSLGDESELVDKVARDDDDSPVAHMLAEQQRKQQSIPSVDGEASGTGKSATGKKASKQSGQKSKLSIWLPLRFPPVPKKGEFDVRDVSESRYFFH